MKLIFSVRELRFSDPPTPTPAFATVRVSTTPAEGLLTTEFIDLRFRITGLPDGDAAFAAAPARALAVARELVNESAASRLLQEQKAE